MLQREGVGINTQCIQCGRRRAIGDNQRRVGDLLDWFIGSVGVVIVRCDNQPRMPRKYFNNPAPWHTPSSARKFLHVLRVASSCPAPTCQKLTVSCVRSEPGKLPKRLKKGSAIIVAIHAQNLAADPNARKKFGTLRSKCLRAQSGNGSSGLQPSP